jgi:hypothetical protein
MSLCVVLVCSNALTKYLWYVKSVPKWQCLFLIKIYFSVICWAQVSHSYNPSYSGGRDRKIIFWSQPLANSSQGLILTKPLTQKRAGRVTQAVRGPTPKMWELSWKPLSHQKIFFSVIFHALFLLMEFEFSFT